MTATRAHDPWVRAANRYATYSRHRLECSCGTVGLWRRLKKSAYEDANQHLLSAANPDQTGAEDYR